MVEIEKQHDVKFTYSDDDLTGNVITTPQKNLSLSEVIDYLNSTTLFNFKVLNDRFITVSFLDKKITICGKVIDSQTLEPLTLASIIINNGNIGANTDDNGDFFFKKTPINTTATISYIGYNSITLPVKELFETPCKEISLNELSEELSEIIIPNFLTSGLQKNIDGSTTLNSKKFGILPGLIEPDILKTIKVLPGIESVNESIANINVRGGTNDQNLMLWDGIKMYHTGHFFGLISAYNPYLTKKATVIKNGTSSQFSDGVSSTVNMLTDNEITRRFSGGGGFNLLSGDAFIHIPISNKLEIHASARRSFTDILNTPTYNNYFDRSFQENSIASNKEHKTTTNFYFYDYSFKVLYDINNKHSLRANLINIKNNLDYTEEYTSENTTFEENSLLKQENLGANITWKANWNNRFSSELSTFLSEYTINSSDFNIDSNQLQTQFNNVLETEIKLLTKYQFSDILNFTNGAVFNEIGIANKTTVNAPSYTKSVKDVLLKSAIFSELEYKKKNTYARLGLRANYFHDFNQFLIEPRINVRQKVINNLYLKLKGELKNQTTTQKIDFQDNFLGIEKRRWVLADNDKTPIIKSKQISFGTEFSKNNLQIDLTGFYKFVDGITAANQGFYNNVQTLNSIGSYESKGVEFLINKKSKKISTWLSYTFAENDYTFNTFSPSIFPSSLNITHSLSAALNYSITPKIRLSAGTILRNGTPYTTPVVGNETIQYGDRTVVNYDTPNKERLRNFFRVNASGSYQFNISNNIKSTVRVGFTNITNRKNSINTYYVIDNNSETNVRKVNTYSLPFTPNLSFRINF
ncbi:TonB-dependent receptor [Tenacibaculum lutimaris]|uniref:TonB-dependent receptor n=1 Tax=Tenacibaculum lutimaris TaxID=285258 RepID=UPI001FE49CA1|nr:carboxypeptidase-like regulatory domain-containing protein [Tenacibaculum lutimaris]